MYRGLDLADMDVGALPAESFKLRYTFFVIALSFSFACIPPLLSWLTANLRSTGASTLAVPLNVSIGQVGQIIGKATLHCPYMTRADLRVQVSTSTRPTSLLDPPRATTPMPAS